MRNGCNQASKLAFLLLFCLTACVGEGDLLITKLDRLGNDVNGINEPVISHTDWSGNGIRDIKEPAIPKPIFPVLSARAAYNLAINADGELYAWEYNKFGQLGDGTSRYQFTPIAVKIPNLKRVVKK